MPQKTKVHPKPLKISFFSCACLCVCVSMCVCVCIGVYIMIIPRVRNVLGICFWDVSTCEELVNGTFSSCAAPFSEYFSFIPVITICSNLQTTIYFCFATYSEIKHVKQNQTKNYDYSMSAKKLGFYLWSQSPQVNFSCFLKLT